MSEHQIMPPLDAATEAALRASIERFGVIVPVVLDQDDNVIDGHHRRRIAEELGVEYRTDHRVVESPEEARELAASLNLDRRHLDPETRQEIVAALTAEGHSQRAIARALGVSQKTVDRDLDDVTKRSTESSDSVEQPPERVVGLDGRSRPARRSTSPELAARRQKVREMFEAKASHREIAAALGIAISTVTADLNALGIDAGRSTVASRAARIPIMREMAAKGATRSQAARRLGLSQYQFNELAKRHGIEFRADKVMGKTRKFNPDEFVERSVYALQRGTEMFFEALGESDSDDPRWGDVTPEVAQTATNELMGVAQNIHRVRRQLQKGRPESGASEHLLDGREQRQASLNVFPADWRAFKDAAAAEGASAASILGRLVEGYLNKEQT